MGDYYLMLLEQAEAERYEEEEDGWLTGLTWEEPEDLDMPF